MKKIFLSIIIIPVLVFSIFGNNTVLALTQKSLDDNVDKLVALKEAIFSSDRVGEYDINISVPGYEREKISGYNFIIVMDGSYSTDGEAVWNKMRKSVIDMVNALLPEEDSSMNINKMALISFGVDYHINIPLTSDKTVFDKVLPYYKGGSLLSPGRSATNTEAGLKGAREYIESIMNTKLAKDKEHTYVIYLSDGGVNLTETPFNYYNYLINNSSMLSYARDNLATTLAELDISDDSVTYDKIFDDMMGDLRFLYSGNANDETSINDIIMELGYSSDTITNFLNEKIADFFQYCGYDLNKEYSAGEFERMFVNKQLITGNNSLRNYLLNTVYYALSSCSIRGSNGVSRTIAEGNRLKNYATIYTIGYNAWRDDAKQILDPTYYKNVDVEHYSSGYYYANADSINEKLNSLIADIIRVSFKNPTIVDYTSKWVKPLDINGDGIFDEKDIIITNNGQIVNNAIIKVEKLTQEEINLLLDDNVTGNKNDNVYRIIWNITDYLHSWDKYQLTYKVKIDTQEDGFISEKKYHANGNVSLNYDIIEIKNNDAGNKTEEIIDEDVSGEVIICDLVSQKENTILITKTDESGNFLSGSDFDIISNDGIKQVIKEYSIDGINYTSDNSNYNAVYFRFRGLYDYKYILSEVVVPSNYISCNDISFNFFNLEGINRNVSIKNTHKTGDVIVHYVVRVEDKYIPFNEFAYDENGNLLEIFKGININDIILSGKIGDEFKTSYDNIDGLTLDGLYIGNLLVYDNVNKLDNNIMFGKYTEQKQEYTYVFNLSIGDGENIPLPPVTGYDGDNSSNNILSLILSYLFILFELFC